jgi:putative ABC transport system substrate-binding protein
MPAVAKDLVAQKPDVVVAVSDWAVHALRATGAPVPIVASPMGADPVTAGVARSWANPGGNVTGVSILATQLDIKRLSLLREAMPSLRRVAVLSNHRPGIERGLQPLRAAATSAGLDLAEIWVENSPGDIPQAFETARSAQVEAIMVIPTPELARDVGVIVGLATIARVASIGGSREAAKAGLLIGYGPNLRELMLQAADYVGRILKGAHPGDLPFQGPARFDLAVNLKTARTLGLDLPPQLMGSAEEVFE